jgi:hypothetical protein
MRLDTVDIRDFRSIFTDDAGRTFSVELAEGMNTFVGQNNCGKSNVLRAISLALDPNHRYSVDDDAPGLRPFAHPEITLRFRADGDRPEQAELMDVAEAYERSLGVPAAGTYAARGELWLRVAFVPGAAGVERQELLLAPGQRTPTTDEQRELMATALDRLHDAVRFVLISSGESIESVLEGNFREILHSVVRERLQREFGQAEESRQQYIAGLQNSLLAPLRDRLGHDVAGLFPEIGDIELAPEVLSIDRTLSNVGVNLNDTVRTPLAGKGTGVRGGLLVAMLSYLALNATRGMVFALEEPEAFLHPAAQELLRDQLEELAAASGVTLLVTTHSPFVVTRAASGRVFCLAKDTEGRTCLGAVASGDADHAPLIGGLMRELALESLLASASAIPEGTRGIVLLEGDGDRVCLRLAAELVGRPDLLDGILLRPAGSALKMIAEAVVVRAAAGARPLVLIVDNDSPGIHVRTTLTGSTFGFDKKQIVSYVTLFPAQWQNFPVEAEDLFPPPLIERFIAELGQSVMEGSKKRPDGLFHYDLGQAAKKQLEPWLAVEAVAEDVRLWLELILRLRVQLGLPVEDTVDELVVNAPDRPQREEAPVGRALIGTGPHDYAFYNRWHALLLPTSQQVPDGVTHVGFYSSAAVQPTFPAIVANYPHLLLAAETAKQLRATGKEGDARVASLVEDVVRSDASLSDGTYRVLLLSGPDDEATVRLEQPIRNTKMHLDKRLAWTVGPRVVTMASLRAAPETTEELDALERKGMAG